MCRRFARGRSRDTLTNAVLGRRKVLATHTAEERDLHSANAAADTVLGARGSRTVAGKPAAEATSTLTRCSAQDDVEASFEFARF